MLHVFGIEFDEILERHPKVAEIMGVSRTKAYQIVRDMNRELRSMGYITVSGKCPVQYFEKKFYGLRIGGEAG